MLTIDGFNPTGNEGPVLIVGILWLVEVGVTVSPVWAVVSMLKYVTCLEIPFSVSTSNLMLCGPSARLESVMFPLKLSPLYESLPMESKVK